MNKIIYVIIGLVLLFIIVKPSISSDKFIYGIGVHPGHYDSASLGSLQSNYSLKLLKDLGVSMAREDIQWIRTEKVKNVYNFTDSDRRIDLLRGQGIETLPILTYGNPLYANVPVGTYWAGDRYMPPRGTQAWEDYKVAFAKFIYESVKHFSEKYNMKYYEIWNEPYGFYDPQTDSLEERAIKYVELMSLAYPAAKKANPKAQILIGGQYITSGEGTYNRYLYRYGISKYFDIHNIHPYMYAGVNPNIPFELYGYNDSNSNMVNKWMEDFEQLVNDYGDGDKDWWVTEMGVYSEGCGISKNYSFDGKFSYYVSHCANGTSRENQAIAVRNHIKYLKENFPQIKAFFWYDYREDAKTRVFQLPGCPVDYISATCPVHHEARFGIVDWNWQPKPAYYEYQKIIQDAKSKGLARDVLNEVI